MPKITLRKIISNDLKYFSKWWRDVELLKLTSGNLEQISDDEVKKYFSMILSTTNAYHFMILNENVVIGHISLSREENDWYETKIVIGKSEYWGRGYGTDAINLLLKKARNFGITKIYLEVRPENVRAINSYQKCGFKKVRIEKYPNNKNLTETLRMELVEN